MSLAALDLLGIFVFALSGATLAVQQRLDAFGVLFLAGVAALGGGVARDLLLGVPPAALQDSRYLLAPLVAGTAVFFFSPLVDRLAGAVRLFDAAGLGLFVAAGTSKALDAGLGAVPAVAVPAVVAAVPAPALPVAEDEDGGEAEEDGPETLVAGRNLRVHKQVRVRPERVETPLLHEDLEVTRVTVNRVVDGPVPVRTEGDITIYSVLEEVLVVEKRLMVREELHVRVRRSETVETRHFELRAEEIAVEEQTAVRRVPLESDEPEAAHEAAVAVSLASEAADVSGTPGALEAPAEASGAPEDLEDTRAATVTEETQAAVETEAAVARFIDSAWP